MSAVDLTTDEGFCYIEDDDYEDHEVGTEDDCEQGDRSSSSDEEGGRSSQHVDYRSLHLEQGRRTRRRREGRGAELPLHAAYLGQSSFLQDRREGAVRQPVDITVEESEQLRHHVGRAFDPPRGLRPGPQRPTGRRCGAALGGEPVWRQGRRDTVAGIALFSNPAPGGGRVFSVEDPQHQSQAPSVHQSQPLSEGFNSSRDGVQSRSDRRFPRRHREKKNGNWTDEQLRCAMAAVDDGKTMKAAAKENNIPYSSFRDHCYGKTRSRKRGVQSVLTPGEEQEIVEYLVKMCDMGFGLSPSALKMKVYEITKDRMTPFRDGIPGGGWMKWFRFRHPELTLRASQGLESARARALCPQNVQTLYGNLQRLYNLHNYGPERIWNCDESGAQAGKSGGGMVIAKTGAKRVQSIVPNQREWLSVLVCVNAAGQSIPSFYIFRGRRFRKNYIIHCEQGATMAMQPRAWMTSYLFSAWISHFIASIRRHSVISPEHRHLLILDGHNSHVTLEVVRLAKNVGLDLITLPSHTSHALQPLDVSVFKPFKQYFREYRDYWTSRNIDQSATKEVLAQWVSLGLRKALSVRNISSGFRRTGIYPLNCRAADAHVTPSEVYKSPGRLDLADAPSSTEEAVFGDQEEQAGDNQQPMGDEERHNVPSGTGQEDGHSLPAGTTLYVPVSTEEDIAADFGRQPQAGTEHFFVSAEPSEEAADSNVGTLDMEAPEPVSITQFLQLPQFTPNARSCRRDPVVDFAKSVILTSSEYEDTAARIITAREDAAKEKERQKQEREESKKRKLEEREAAMARRAASREEAQRLKDLKAAERAETQARKAAEREEAARVKAERAYQLAMARAEKAAQRSSRADDLRSRASETMEVRRNGEEGLWARGWGCWTGDSTSEGAALLHHNLQTSSPFAPLLHTPPYYPHVTAQPPHAPFFFSSPSSGLPSLSQIDVSPHSTRPPITQNVHQFQLPPTARSHPRNPSMQREGGRV